MKLGEVQSKFNSDFILFNLSQMTSTSLRFTPMKWKDNTHVFDPLSPDGAPATDPK